VSTAPGSTGPPVSELDPFSDEFLNDPYPGHHELRECSPAVWLPSYGVWALARHECVAAALKDPATFCSSAGVGLANLRKEDPWRPPSLLLEADPPEHRRARRIVTRVLTPTVLRQLKAGFLAYARRLVDDLATQGSFDAIADLAEAFVLRVFPDLVGLPTKGRDNLLAQSIHPYMSETAAGKAKRGRGKAGMANGYGHGVVAPMCETPRAGTLSAWLTHMLMP
jgi:cytochrome P450